ncbi:MAG: putative lipid II flippase FtsW [Candidatus Pacebacteria bacterium]|nr:putative lipid II flippase FtsW [Candidatus Paceibacterota bacterium]
MSKKLSRLKPVDNILLGLLGVLVVGGFFIFLSASLGLLDKGKVSFSSIAFNQFFLGIVLGVIMAFVMSRINYKSLRKYSPYILGLSLISTLLVFLPGVGMSWGGASRWVHFGTVTFQPVEFLKIGVIIFTAHFLAHYARKVKAHGYFGVVALGIGISIVTIPLLLQPDTGSLIVITIAVVSMFFVSGLKWRDVGIMILTGILALVLLAFMRPYVFDRITTFLHPGNDVQGSGYQIKQSLIAVGSGGVFGRGFGQSVQKFNYLPEPIGDSIFAVYAEEFGFVGSTLLLSVFLALLLRMYHIAIKAPDMFGALLVVGVATLIIVQSLFNISAMLGVVPLSGLPLIFVSHGGTALATTLASIGIVLNISRYRKS